MIGELIEQVVDAVVISADKNTPKGCFIAALILLLVLSAIWINYIP